MNNRKPPCTTKFPPRAKASANQFPLAGRSALPRQNLCLHDIEMMYVECSKCGRPIIWDAGQTTEYLLAADANLNALDAACMIVSDGCPACLPSDDQAFCLSVVRMIDLTIDEIILMASPRGSA